MMWPSGSMITPDPDPGLFGTRSCGSSRPLPVVVMGKRFTTDGLAASANSVITVWISSNNCRPVDVPAVPTGISAASAEARRRDEEKRIPTGSRRGDSRIVRIDPLFPVYHPEVRKFTGKRHSQAIGSGLLYADLVLRVCVNHTAT